MLSITLIAMGRKIDSYYGEATGEYAKRLSAFSNFQLIELEEYRLPSNPSPSQIEQGLEKEADMILSKVPPRSVLVTLCIEGKMISSNELSNKIQRWSETTSHLVFVIGSSHGLCSRVKEQSNFRLSMSPMTFPHQLARVMLCEQIYRACSIAYGGKYHK